MQTYVFLQFECTPEAAVFLLADRGPGWPELGLSDQVVIGPLEAREVVSGVPPLRTCHSPTPRRLRFNL